MSTRKSASTEQPKPALMRKGLPKTKTKRTCRVCGENPWPNRFFCRACHDYVSSAFDLSLDC